MVFPGGTDINTFRDHDAPPPPGWVLPTIVVLVTMLVFGSMFVLHRRWRNKKRAKHAREIAQQEAEQAKAKALEDQKKFLELKKQEMKFPDGWEMDADEFMTVAGEKNVRVKVPKRGLFTVPSDSTEYWDVVDILRKPPNPEHVRIDPRTGRSSDTRGMQDAWITKLERIQVS
eukprot:COSAG02_NODE_2251_length_9362_cov_19.062075_3_plen_173_part_00